MGALSGLDQHPFVQQVLEEGLELLPHINADPHAIEMPDGVVLDEQQYYVQKVGFFLVHSLTWFKQLDLAIEFLSNFDYSKKIDASRADHLIYNLENYLIRVNSAYDRILQLVNSVFHLCISDEHVSHAVIVSNHKVQHRSGVVRKTKALQKFLANYAQARHTIIHKHSWLDAKMRRIELYYMHDLDALSDDDGWKERLRNVRSQYLRNFVSEKKDEFRKLNSRLESRISELFTELRPEYQRQLELLGLSIRCEGGIEP